MKYLSALAVNLLSPAAAAALLSALLPAPAFAASADSNELEAYLSGRYYEVEFFVFERPAVLDFSSEEILTLHRPRALPNALRTQRLAVESLWNESLDPMTRACLTFPTLTYELLPAERQIDAQSEALASPEDTIQTEVALETDLGELPLSAPVPQIAPVLESDPQLDFLASLAAFERSLEADSQRWQPAENFQLSRTANRIERRGLGRILFHGRWLQAVPEREAPDPILVRGGERLSAPLASHELIGTVGITLGRYLHFKADLFFHAPGLGLTPTAALMTSSGEGELLSVADPEDQPGYMHLSESRRMRSEELHYLDHPKLGVVVRVDPIRIPETLIEQLEALETLEESTD